MAENEPQETNPEELLTYKGVCYFFSETGTEGGFWAFQDERFMKPAKDNQQEQWSYDGLHVLKTGDGLRIFSPDNKDKVVWEGKISLKEYDSFKEDAGGLWIHSDQEGIDRNEWFEFFKREYPAELTTRKLQETGQE